MNKKLVIIGIAYLILAATAKAELAIIQPNTGTTTSLTTTQGTPATLEITIENQGNTTIQQISLETDLNAEFWPPSFGLEPKNQKTVTATFYAQKNTQGSITVENSEIFVEIEVTEKPDAMQEFFNKLEENRESIGLLMQIVMGTAFLIAVVAIAYMATKK